MLIYELPVFFCDRGQRSQDECHRVKVRSYLGSFFRADADLDIFPECEHSLFFRHEHRGQERGIHLTELNHDLNTVSAGGTLIVAEWLLVST